MTIKRRKTFTKSVLNVPYKLAIKVTETLEIFLNQPFQNELRNHALKGKRIGHRSIDVTGDRRIIFKELSNGRYELVELVELGTHSQLYK